MSELLRMVGADVEGLLGSGWRESKHEPLTWFAGPEDGRGLFVKVRVALSHAEPLIIVGRRCHAEVPVSRQEFPVRGTSVGDYAEACRAVAEAKRLLGDLEDAYGRVEEVLS